MKKISFSFKSLLVAAGLLIGSANAWGQYSLTDNGDGTWTETYDFENCGAPNKEVFNKTFQTTEKYGYSNGGSSDKKYYSILDDHSNIKFNGRFAVPTDYAGNWFYYNNASKGWYNGGSGNRAFAILNLKEGDEVTMTVTTSPVFATSNAYLKSDGTKTNVIAGTTSWTSDATYVMASDGRLQGYMAKNNWIKKVVIVTSSPVLSSPTATFNSMVESGGLYYPKYTFSSTDDGVKFYDGDGNEITSGYTFMSVGSQAVYASKSGRTNSAKVSFSADKVGMILANSIDLSSYTGIVDYSTGTVFNTGRFDDSGMLGTVLIPGLSFSGDYWFKDGSSIYTGSGARTVSCTVLNENRIATFRHYYYSKESTVYDYLTSTSNSASIGRQGGSSPKNDRLYNYDLYVSPSDKASVTIGTTGYSTFACPVPLDFSGIDGLTAFVATTVADGAVTLKSVTTAPANTGLVLKGTASETYEIPVTASAEAPESNLLVGCIVETTVAVNATSKFNNYVLAIEDGVAKFQSLVEFGATIPAGKAFLKNGAVGGGVKALSVVFNDTATGIEAASVVEEAEEEGVLYNTAGQVVTKDYKGIVIKNGKKFINK